MNEIKVGKRVDVEGEGMGTIVEVTDQNVFITIDGKASFICVAKTELKEP